MVTPFSDHERQGVYRAIYERRDVRSRFVPQPLPDKVLSRILDAAHHAPSVGLMQPWAFIVIADAEIRREVREQFDAANQRAADAYAGERRDLYDRLKLDAIVDSAVNVCVTCDPTVGRGHGLGRQTMPETAMYSTVCAIQNAWLAARAEGVGMGWVSILDVDAIRRILTIPPHLVVVGYLCLGYVSAFEAAPELATRGWECRVPLAQALHFERYGGDDTRRAHALAQLSDPAGVRR
ncbi:MAG TPA: 5,6-dimethylbenzimidazole synthase [Vicinamibacterales bacterium]|nr:5,6-dimethylbenzimidazole synthase [Vicinamibacterales bacterium]